MCHGGAAIVRLLSMACALLTVHALGVSRPFPSRSQDLKPTFYFWELIEMGRRLVLLGFMSVIEPGTVLQLMIANVFSLLYTVIQLQASPYRDESDGYMAVCVSSCITLCLMCCLVFKFDNLTGLSAIRQMMSYQQRLWYSPQEVPLVILMFAGVFLTLFAGVSSQRLKPWATPCSLRRS